MSATIGLFLLLYSITAYLIFKHGLAYISRLPAAGDLLTDRVIHLIFFCFFLMLAFSAGVATYIALFRSKETSWMLTLPLSHRVVCLWKFMEASLFSSWGLLFITAPLLIAFAQHREVGAAFYLKTASSMIPFAIISTGTALILLLLIVRWFKRIHLLYAAIMIALTGAYTGLKTYQSDKELSEKTGLSAALTLQLVLQHTDISTSPLLPSTWLAKSAIDWSHPWRLDNDPLNLALLYSNALMVLLLATWLAKYYFFSARSRSLQHAASIAARQRERPPNSAYPANPAKRFRLPQSPMLAISVKDIRSFVREPGLWLQFLVIFTLLALYAISLRHMDFNRASAQETQMFAFLNLTVCALALSTLTTRFVFPQFSLEGRRFWILAMSPINLSRIILQKLVISTLFTGSATFAILLLSGHMLKLHSSDIAFFASAIVLLSIGLNAIAVGFGAIFPNLKESNSAKIVSGFGGTLCLITSFAYVALIIGCLILAQTALLKSGSPTNIQSILANPTALAALVSAFIISALASILPIIFSIKTINKLVFLDEL